MGSSWHRGGEAGGRIEWFDGLVSVMVVVRFMIVRGLYWGSYLVGGKKGESLVGQLVGNQKRRLNMSESKGLLFHGSC
jgi:hypothetical protein